MKKTFLMLLLSVVLVLNGCKVSDTETESSDAETGSSNAETGSGDTETGSKDLIISQALKFSLKDFSFTYTDNEYERYEFFTKRPAAQYDHEQFESTYFNEDLTKRTSIFIDRYDGLYNGQNIDNEVLHLERLEIDINKESPPKPLYDAKENLITDLEGYTFYKYVPRRGEYWVSKKYAPADTVTPNEQWIKMENIFVVFGIHEFVKIEGDKIYIYNVLDYKDKNGDKYYILATVEPMVYEKSK